MKSRDLSYAVDGIEGRYVSRPTFYEIRLISFHNERTNETYDDIPAP